MERLWTPWRMPYLVSEKSSTCIFCQKVQATDDRAAHVLTRGRHGFVTLNLYPYNNGHLMVVPYAHVPSLEDLPPETLTELMLLVNRSLTILRFAFRPHGFNLGVNLGKVAGAGIEEHVHIHIVPRWEADTNFMPIVAETRVIPEWIDDTYDRLAEAQRTLVANGSLPANASWPSSDGNDE
ncbi:MAG: HIT domain-containing protein [Anaerolineae bacterium]|nr:HIT domain-containing protein [Anaerolineae bacterium]